MATLAAVTLAVLAAGLLGDDDPETAEPGRSTTTAPAVTTLPSAAAVAAAPPAAPPTEPVDTGAPTGDAGAALTATEVEAYLRDYYDAVAARDYERTWAQLAPEFQSGTARSFDYYAGFWDDNDLEVGDVELVRADGDGAVVEAELFWNGSDDAVVSRFTLRRGDDGTLLIAAQE